MQSKGYFIKRFIFFFLIPIFLSCGGGGGGGDSSYINGDCSLPLLGLTKEQAIEDIIEQTIQRGLSPKEEAIGVDAIERLTPLGVSVDSAYQLIIACFDQGIRAKEIAPIVRAVEMVVPIAGPEVTDIATTAIMNHYNPDDVIDIIVTVETGTNAGAGSEIPEEIVCMGVKRSLGSDVIKEIIDGFVDDINSGLSPQKARDNAIGKM